MNKKIKIIDLLVKIAKGEEIPKKIEYQGEIYEWDEEALKYADHTGYTLEIYTKKIDLNDEVEILEDNTEEIEEILYKLPEYRTSEDYDYRDIKANRILINKLVEVVEKEIRKDKSNDK